MTLKRDKPRASASSHTLWILAGLVVLGLLVRAPRLGESLWYDEIAAWMDYGRHGPGRIITNYYDPANHIAHTLASWISYSLLAGQIGDGLALRTPALLFSLASILAVWGMTTCAIKKGSGTFFSVDHGEKRCLTPFSSESAPDRAAGQSLKPRVGPGILAALLMAVLPISVLEGSEARGYSMMICFSALMTWILLSALNKERWTKWLLYAAICPLGLWAHMMTVWVPVGHGAFLAWMFLRGGHPPAEPGAEGREGAVAARGFAIRGMAAIGLAAGITLLLYWPVLDDILRIRSEFVSVEGDEPGVFGIEGWHTLLLLGGAWYWWAAAPGLTAFLVGLVTLLRFAKPRAAVGAALLGLPIMVIAVWAAGSWMYARFALFALPGVVMLTAIGIDRLWRWKQAAGVALLCLIIIGAGADLGLRPSRQPLREAAAYVQTNGNPDDGLVIVGLRHQVMDVYAIDLDPAYSLRHGDDLVAQLEATQPRWLIVMYPRNVGKDQLDAIAARGFAMVRRFDGWIDWGNGAIEVWERGAR